MRFFSASLQELVLSPWRNRSLIFTLVQREVIGRYRGSVMGILWSFLNPVFMLLVYTFVFSVVFKARLGEGGDSKTEFALILFSGLLVFNFFSECINRAPSLILANTNYVKKVIFPLEILPWVPLGAALFHMFVSLFVWVLFYAFFFGQPHLTLFLFPLVVLPLIFFVMALSWVLACCGAYLRDVSQFTGLLTTVLLFLSPIFYPVTALPEKYRFLLNLNPLTPVIEQTRLILISGKIPSVSQWMIYLTVSFLIAWGCFFFFQRARKFFADAL